MLDTPRTAVLASKILPVTTMGLVRLGIHCLLISSAGLSTIGLSGCGPANRDLEMDRSDTDREVQAMLQKMGVPGGSAVPSRTAMALDCPPVQAMLDAVRQSAEPISRNSRQSLKAWAQWCDLQPLAEPTS